MSTRPCACATEIILGGDSTALVEAVFLDEASVMRSRRWRNGCHPFLWYSGLMGGRGGHAFASASQAGRGSASDARS